MRTGSKTPRSPISTNCLRSPNHRGGGYARGGWPRTPSCTTRSATRKNSLARRNTVLGQMKRNGMLTVQQVDSLRALPLQTRLPDADPYAGHRAVFPRIHPRDRPRIPRKCPQAGRKSVFPFSRDGLRIYTTLDSRMQRYAEEAVNEHLSNLQKVFDYGQQAKPHAAVLPHHPRPGRCHHECGRQTQRPLPCFSRRRVLPKPKSARASRRRKR